MYKKTLKQVETPTDIFIFGSGNDADFGITDDYSSFDICIDEKFEVNADCIGYCSILTSENFLEAVQTEFEDQYGEDNTDEEDKEEFLEELFEGGSIDAFLLSGFVGDVDLKVKIGGEYADLTNCGDEDLMYCDYGLTEEESRNRNMDIIVDLPKNTKLSRVTMEMYSTMIKLDKRKTILKDIKK